MKQVDDNGDGEISYQEFSEMMHGQTKWSCDWYLNTKWRYQ
jgi:hypothetical protein